MKYPKYENDYVPTIHFSKNVFLEFRNDWLQFAIFSKNTNWNWYDISIALLEIHAEKDEMISGWDIDIRLIGFGIRLRWNTEPNESTKEIINRVKEYDKTQEIK